MGSCMCMEVAVCPEPEMQLTFQDGDASSKPLEKAGDSCHNFRCRRGDKNAALPHVDVAERKPARPPSVAVFCFNSGWGAPTRRPEVVTPRFGAYQPEHKEAPGMASPLGLPEEMMWPLRKQGSASSVSTVATEDW
ncbi:unnamed protein product [Durusdinium trenchii]|uniref:Uncharacterized protein n=2 Tax=Durusdinium trenchii TaxID=1381693 RepID=A0ABP0ML09_9DINO|eukprot:g15286.t1